jgi:hypothetical protein
MWSTIVPAELVVLRVVGRVARVDGEGEGLTAQLARAERVELAHHRVEDEGGLHFLGPERRSEGKRVPDDDGIHVLDPGGRLRIDDVRVGELGEVQAGDTPERSARLGEGAQIFAQEGRLTGPVRELLVLSARADDGLAHGSAARRRPRAPP